MHLILTPSKGSSSPRRAIPLGKDLGEKFFTYFMYIYLSMDIKSSDTAPF
jgi:hypothetical protein